jgi:hypothetical protein
MFCSVQYEAALAVDAIFVVERALKAMVTENPKIFKSTFRRKEVYNNNRTKGIPCTTNPPIPWMHGEAIMAHIKTVILQLLKSFNVFVSLILEAKKKDLHILYL